MKRFLLTVCFLGFCWQFNLAAEEGKGVPKLILRIDFEDPISGNGSNVFDTSIPGEETKWGKTAGIVAYTAMAKEGKAWKPEHRVAGKSGYAYFFGGDEEKRYITIPYSETLEPGKDDFSLSLWIKTVAEEGYLVLKTTTAPYWVVHLSKGKPRLMLNDGTGPTMVLAGKKEVNDGNWHHLVLTVKSNQALRFFVDGKMDAESALGKLGDMTKKAAIGIGGYGYASGYFQGSIDSFRLYRGALSSEEIVKIFNEG